MDKPKDEKKNTKLKQCVKFAAYIGIAIIVIVAIGSNYSEFKSEKGRPTGTTVSQEPTEKVLTVDDKTWQGISNFDQSKKIKLDMVTRGVWWEVMCDRDTNKVFTLYPANWEGTNKVRALPDSNILECRVKPGQQITQAIIVARVVSRN